MDKKKIVLSAFIGSDNTGDEAIFVSILSSILEGMENARLYAISINPNKTLTLIKRINSQKKIHIIYSRNLLSVLNSILRCDIFICGGGGLLQDETSLYNIPYHLWKPFIAKVFRKKVMFYAVGAGPIESRFSKLVVRFVLKLADIITTRDKKSKEILVDLSIDPNKIIVSTDPTLTLPFPNDQQGKKLFEIEHIPLEKPLLGVCLRNWFYTHRFIPLSISYKFSIRGRKDRVKYDNFVEEIARSLDYYIEEYDANAVFIPFHKGRDDRVHSDVMKLMKYQSRAYTIKDCYSPYEIIGIISKLKMLLGMRLHSIIFASSSFVPFLAIEYMPKIRDFFYELFENDEEPLIIKIDKIERKIIRNRMDYIMNNRNQITVKLKSASKKFVYRDSENIAALSNLLD